MDCFIAGDKWGRMGMNALPPVGGSLASVLRHNVAQAGRRRLGFDAVHPGMTRAKSFGMLVDHKGGWGAHPPKWAIWRSGDPVIKKTKLPQRTQRARRKNLHHRGHRDAQRNRSVLLAPVIAVIRGFAPRLSRDRRDRRVIGNARADRVTWVL